MQWSIKKLQRSWWEASLLFQLVLDYAASEKVLQSHLISASYCWKKLCCTDALGVSALFSTLSMSFPLSLLLDQADTNFSMFLQLSSSDLTWEMVFSGLCPQAAADATPPEYCSFKCFNLQLGIQEITRHCLRGVDLLHIQVPWSQISFL